MRLKSLAIGLSVGLVALAAIGLLRSINSDASVANAEHKHSPAETTAQPSPTGSHGVDATRLTKLDSPTRLTSSGPESEPPKYNTHVKDPEGAHKVLGFMGQDLGSRAAKEQAVRTAIADSGSCSDTICTKTRASLQSRVDAVAAQMKGSLSTKPIECYQVGCIVDVSAPPGVPLQLALHRLQASGQLDWPVPSMYSIPRMNKDGSQYAVWILFNPADSSSF